MQFSIEFTGFALFVTQHSPPIALRKINGKQIMLSEQEKIGKHVDKQKTHQWADHLSHCPDSSSQRRHQIRLLSLEVYRPELVARALSSEKKKCSVTIRL